MSELYEWYAKEVKVTQNTDEIEYLAVKIVIEVAEATQILVKTKFHKKPFDEEKFLEESSDALWYIFACADWLALEIPECEVSELALQKAIDLDEMEEALLDAAGLLERLKQPAFDPDNAMTLLLGCFSHIELAILSVGFTMEAGGSSSINSIRRSASPSALSG